jgi:hypothetical protein
LIGLLYIFPYNFKTIMRHDTILILRFMFGKEVIVDLSETSFVRSRLWVREFEFVDHQGEVSGLAFSSQIVGGYNR